MKYDFKKDLKVPDEAHANEYGSERNDLVIVRDFFEDGVRVVVIVLRGSHFCTYFGIPKDHPLANEDYVNIPVHVHGGFTFSSTGGEWFPEGYYWYGYDYAHAGDVTHYPLSMKETSPELWELYQRRLLGEHDWTVKEVVSEARSYLYSFTNLMKLAERIAKK